MNIKPRGVVKTRGWYYRELFRFLLKLGVCKPKHGVAGLKYHASSYHMGPRKI